MTNFSLTDEAYNVIAMSRPLVTSFQSNTFVANVLKSGAFGTAIQLTYHNKYQVVIKCQKYGGDPRDSFDEYLIETKTLSTCTQLRKEKGLPFLAYMLDSFVSTKYPDTGLIVIPKAQVTLHTLPPQYKHDRTFFTILRQCIVGINIFHNEVGVVHADAQG